MGSIKDKCAIVGVGETRYGVPGKSNLGLNLEASKIAIEDSGLSKDEIDGVLTQQPYMDPTFMFSTWIGASLGLKMNFSTDLNIGGATPVSMVAHAVMAIEAGLCRAVVCSFGENLRSLGERPGTCRMGGESFENPFGMTMPGVGYAMVAKRHMHDYGTTSDHLGTIAVTARKHAALHPNAERKEPLALEDYYKSPMFFDPFRRLDICLLTNGGAAVVVASAERAKDLKHKPVYISGFAEHHPHRFITQASDMLTTGAKIAGEKAMRMAGIMVNDIDVAEIYDCFTITTLLQLEDYGFCKKGEGGPFIMEGNISPGSKIPVNTHGGLLSQAHIDGMNHIVEAVGQLRGECGERQVKDCEIALVTGNGGIFDTHYSLILRR